MQDLIGCWLLTNRLSDCYLKALQQPLSPVLKEDFKRGSIEIIQNECQIWECNGSSEINENLF